MLHSTFGVTRRKQLLDMWYSINTVPSVEPDTISEILNESIWLNKRILVGNVPIYYKTWIKVGIITIKDCLNRNSFMSQAQQGKHSRAYSILMDKWITISDD